jgi:hypothetical protein
MEPTLAHLQKSSASSRGLTVSLAPDRGSGVSISLAQVAGGSSLSPNLDVDHFICLEQTIYLSSLWEYFEFSVCSLLWFSSLTLVELLLDF